MRRSRPYRLRASDDGREDQHPGRVHDLTVYDAGGHWAPSPILGLDGLPVDETYHGIEPLGFLWNVPRGRSEPQGRELSAGEMIAIRRRLTA